MRHNHHVLDASSGLKLCRIRFVWTEPHIAIRSSLESLAGSPRQPQPPAIEPMSGALAHDSLLRPGCRRAPSTESTHRHSVTYGDCMPINTPLIVCLSLALLLVVIALAREMRLRRALQQLLARFLVLWRSRFDSHPPSAPRPPTHTDSTDNRPADERLPRRQRSRRRRGPSRA